MSKHILSPEELQEIHDLAAAWGKSIAWRSFGESGPDLSVDLSATEQVAEAADVPRQNTTGAARFGEQA